jgi:hypothetical protein
MGADSTPTAADGTRVIDLAQTSFPSHVQTNTIWEAASVIQEICLNDPPPSEGQASRIGTLCFWMEWVNLDIYVFDD